MAMNDSLEPHSSETDGPIAEQAQAATMLPAEEREPAPSLNPLQIVSSVFAAGLGVQSSKNRERDFKQGRAGTFIAAGLIFTLLFIGSVYTVVTLVLRAR